MPFLKQQKKKALHVAENCIECGRCYQYCQFDIFPKKHMKSFYLIRQANSSVMFNTPISKELKNMIFKCSVCDRCYDVCPEGLHRADANLFQKMKLPNPIIQRINFPSILPGLKYGISTRVSLSPKSKEERTWIKSLNTFEPARVMVYHGCYVNFSKETCMRLENILIRAKENYTSVGGNKYCCGGIEGYRGINKFKAAFSKLRKIIEKINPFEIVTQCGHCYEVLNRVVYEMDVDIKVKHASEKIQELLTDRKLKLHRLDTSVTIQDSCLMPHLHEDRGAVRRVLQRITKISEMKSSKHKSLCCGNISLAYSPRLVDEQNKKIIEEFNQTETSHVCTYCPRCFEVFLRYKKQFKPIDFVDLVYDSIFNKQRVSESDVVPHPKKNKEDEGLLSIEGDEPKKSKKKKSIMSEIKSDMSKGIKRTEKTIKKTIKPKKKIRKSKKRKR